MYMVENTSKYKAEVQRIERAEYFDDYRGSAFAKLSIRGLLSSCCSRQLGGKLLSAIALMNRPESPIVSLIVNLYSA